jgi:TPP-dependent pyruvate/acetoin dehydrogenase alpha subunit
MPQSFTDLDLYRQMRRIRRFEEMVLEAFPRGQFYGTTHTYVGQEANAVGVLAGIEDGDVVVSNHRCHGHFLAYGGSMRALAAELMGRQTGVCGGRSGSQHIQWKDFYANGILGGTLPLAVGMSLAEKSAGSRRIVVAFLGDGTLGEGVTYESFNMAALWQLPIMFVLEDNRYAQSTPVRLNLAGGMGDRFAAFGIPHAEADTTDVREIRTLAGNAFSHLRGDGGPCALVLHTYRFSPHSKGDDTRDPAEIAHFRERDPLLVHGGRLDGASLEQVDKEVEIEVAEAFRQAGEDPFADPRALTAPLTSQP